MGSGRARERCMRTEAVLVAEEGGERLKRGEGRSPDASWGPLGAPRTGRGMCRAMLSQHTVQDTYIFTGDPQYIHTNQRLHACIVLGRFGRRASAPHSTLLFNTVQGPAHKLAPPPPPPHNPPRISTILLGLHPTLSSIPKSAVEGDLGISPSPTSACDSTARPFSTQGVREGAEQPCLTCAQQ